MTDRKRYLAIDHAGVLVSRCEGNLQAAWIALRDAEKELRYNEEMQRLSDVIDDALYDARKLRAALRDTVVEMEEKGDA